MTRKQGFWVGMGRTKYNGREKLFQEANTSTVSLERLLDELSFKLHENTYTQGKL